MFFFIRVRFVKIEQFSIFFIKVLDLILGERSEIQFLAIFWLDYKGILIDFEIKHSRF